MLILYYPEKEKDVTEYLRRQFQLEMNGKYFQLYVTLV